MNPFVKYVFAARLCWCGYLNFYVSDSFCRMSMQWRKSVCCCEQGIYKEKDVDVWKRPTFPYATCMCTVHVCWCEMWIVRVPKGVYTYFHNQNIYIYIPEWELNYTLDVFFWERDGFDSMFMFKGVEVFSYFIFFFCKLC